MELQEILGCLGNVEKLDALPLSTLKAAAKKYPYISQLKELLIKKELSPEGLKDYLISSTDHTPSTELKSALELNESDPSLLIRIVKKAPKTAKKTGKKILNLKKDRINPLESKLSLVKPDSKKTQPVDTTKALKEVKATPTAKAKSQTKAAPAVKKRAYVRKSQAAKILQVSPINPPLPDWKDILSKVEIKTTAISSPKLPKTKNTRSRKNTKGSATIKTVAAKTPKTTTQVVKDTPVKKEIKKNSSYSSLASSQNKKIKAEKKVANTTSSTDKKKLSSKKKAPISSKKERLKFSEWLSEKSKKTKSKTKKKSSKTKPKNSLKRLVKSSVVKKEEIATATLAKLYTKQGHYKKAIKVYERLRLLNPEKSSFFASKIRKLKQK